MSINKLYQDIAYVATNFYLKPIEDHFKADVLFYFGGIYDEEKTIFKNFVEKLGKDENKKDILVIILRTKGGSAETAEDFVNIVRHFYESVYFIIPDYAMSAGTIFCMSGDKIYMDYSSHLGPIDPQIYNAKLDKLVPANGYINKFKSLLEKSEKNNLSKGEYLILQNQDLGFLEACENARALSIDLVKKWLVKYKFKNCKESEENKVKRAEEIAECLSDNKKWLSHDRSITLQDLKNLKLIIDDYTTDNRLNSLIQLYNDFMVDYITQYKFPYFIHTRFYF